MLVRFKFKNSRCFKDESVLSMLTSKSHKSRDNIIPAEHGFNYSVALHCMAKMQVEKASPFCV